MRMAGSHRVGQSTTQSIDFRKSNTRATHFVDFDRLLYKKYSTREAIFTSILYSSMSFQYFAQHWPSQPYLIIPPWEKRRTTMK